MQCRTTVTVALLAACGGAYGQNIGPSLGTVELRWRERSTAGYNGSYTIGPWVAPGVDAMPTPDPSAASVTTQDASVVLVLEAKVTQASGIVGNPIRGLRGTEFSITTNQTTGGAWGRQVVPDQVPGINPRGNARVNTTNLGFNPSTLPDHPTSGVPRGLVSPFREAALGAGGLNGPALGHFPSGPNTIHKILAVLQTENLNPMNPEATNPGAYEFAGLDAWVPIYIAAYTITDVTTPREIVLKVVNADNGSPPSLQPTDYGFRAWRGALNSQNADLDLWQLSPGFTSPPTFTVHVIPVPGVAGVVALGCGIVVGRRRRTA